MRVSVILLCVAFGACSSHRKTEDKSPAPDESSVPYYRADPSPADGDGSAETDEATEPQVTIQRWDQPDLSEYRYVQVVDQTGCRWWTELFPGTDQDGPYPVLGKDHRPVCTDRSQEPDGTMESLDKSEADELVAAGKAVPMTPEQAEAWQKRQDDQGNDDHVSDKTSTPDTPSQHEKPAVKPSSTPYIRPRMPIRIGRTWTTI